MQRSSYKYVPEPGEEREAADCVDRLSLMTWTPLCKQRLWQCRFYSLGGPRAVPSAPLCVTVCRKKTLLGPFQLVAKSVQVLARGPENLPGIGACVGLSEPPPGLLHGWSLSFRERKMSATLCCPWLYCTGILAWLWPRINGLWPHAACSFKN